MNLSPDKQLELHGLHNYLDELIILHKNKKLPNKFMLSGRKGIGKSTLAYHLINYILSENEEYSYDLSKKKINKDNRSFKLIKNKTHPNFHLVDIVLEKKTIDISQIKDLILNLNKSILNSKPRIILIDNLEYLNINSANAFLKILEEPPNNTYFILINNNKNILSTIKSRCLNFNIFLNNQISSEIIDKLFDQKISTLIKKDFFDYYFTPGKVLNLVNFSKENDINLTDFNLKKLLILMIDDAYYKKNINIKEILYELIEQFLFYEFKLNKNNFYNYFIKKMNNTKKYNLDDESLFIEFKSQLLNG